MNELEIRDYLANHIEIISKDFVVVRKEFQLKNIDGTNGAVDILARDCYNNYVIIEIKRSNQAARQALHEVTKYARLLKNNLKVKESEIRIIILSTEWEELLIPFSEYSQKTSLFLEGYKLIIDGYAGIVLGAELIKPLKESFSRKFSRCQSLFLYSNYESIANSLSLVIESIQNAKLQDFIVIHMSTKKDLPYPYGLAVVFQSREESYYMDLIESNFPDLIEDIMSYKEENSYEEYIDYLEQSIIGEAISTARADSFEVCYPEKLLSAFEQGWKVDNLHRFGFFKDETRSDEWLIKQVIGFSGDNLLVFEDILETRFENKYKEFKNYLLNYLHFNDELCELTKKIFAVMEEMRENIRIQVYYYNPDDIIWSLAHFASTNSIESLPMFYISLDCLESGYQCIFHGYLVYSGESIKYDILKLLHFSNDDFNYFVYKQLGQIALLNEEIMCEIGLHFAVSRVEVKGLGDIEETRILLDDSHNYDFATFSYKEKELIDDFFHLYKRYSNIM